MSDRAKFIPWHDARKRLSRADFTGHTLRAALEFFARHEISVIGKRPGNLTSERIESLLTSDSLATLTTTVIHTTDGLFVDVKVDWLQLLRKLVEAGYPVQLPGKTLDESLNKWAWERWGPNFENLPGRDDLLALAREDVSPNVSEAQVRHIRKKYATTEAIKGGANFHRNKRSQ